MDNALEKLATDSGPLLHIRGRPTPAGYESLRLVFERGSLVLAVEVDTDEIVVRTDTVTPAADELPEVDDAVLTSLVGKVIELAWTLTNHRGYTDAFQIRGLDLETREESCCQFEAAAAVISVSGVG